MSWDLTLPFGTRPSREELEERQAVAEVRRLLAKGPAAVAEYTREDSRRRAREALERALGGAHG